MKKIFKNRRFGRSNSTSTSDSNHEIARSLNITPEQNRRYSLPNQQYSFEILHSTNDSNTNAVNDDDNISPHDSPNNESIALSETDTLFYDKKQRLELQETYNENFTLYLPFVLRQMRLESLRLMDRANVNGNITENLDGQFNDIPNVMLGLDSINDDQPTIVNESINLDPALSGDLILNKHTSKFNFKRQLVIVNEFIKHNTYVFPSDESFKLFKQLRSNIRKEKKNSIMLYDVDGTIKRISNVPREEIENNVEGGLIDNRSHIIPLNYKVQGLGLPIFKVHVPYMASFRKNSPFMVFKRYREVPLKPSIHDNVNSSSENECVNFETFTFCTVHVKHFQAVKRYIFTFNPEGRKSFKIIMFQNNFKPFSDFNYKNTRFRVIGTPITSVYLLTYNPTLKLLIIDDEKPSLCDSIINKKPGFELSSLIRKRRNSTEEQSPFKLEDEQIFGDESNGSNPNTFSNPYPNLSNPLLNDENLNPYAFSRNFISDKLPPFGNFKDSIMYLDHSSINILPKKYSEVGKFEFYQDNSSLNLEDLNSTLSIDLDSLVLTCIMLTLREISLRNSKSSNSGIGLGGRFNGFSTYSNQFSAYNSISLASEL